MKTRVLAVILLCLILTVTCTTVPIRTVNPKNPSLMLPERVMIENIKIERGQSFRDCVPVALEAVFKFYGKDIDRKEIEDKIHKGWGTKMKDALEYVRRQGFSSYSFTDMTQDKRRIKFYLSQYFPVLTIGGGLSWKSHIVVLVGYNDIKKVFYIVDPEWRAIQQKRYLDFNEWHGRQGNYGYIVYPSSRLLEKGE